MCLLLIDYARRLRVKVWGTARVVPASDELLAQLSSPGYRGRPEQVVSIAVRAWDANCPRHIPQELDAADVERALAQLRKRVTELEQENRRLKGG